MRTLTLASEDSEYGVQLKAEPDSKRLGERLKGEFKKLAPAIKALRNEDLAVLQEKGELEVMGHVLTQEDIKVRVGGEGGREGGRGREGGGGGGREGRG